MSTFTIPGLNARIKDLEEQQGQAPAAPPVTAERFDSGPVLRAGKRPVPESASETTQSIPLGELRKQATS